jgi:hypothetical protein
LRRQGDTNEARSFSHANASCTPADKPALVVTTASVHLLRAMLEHREREVLALRQAILVLTGAQVRVEPIAVDRSQEYRDLGVTAAAKHFLRERGPSDTRTIADTLLDRGLKTRSKNWIATVYATLSNGAAFRREDALWHLVVDAQEPADGHAA